MSTTPASPTWNPALYLRFADERTQPCRDLVVRLPPRAYQSIIDLGCGPGNSTAVLAAAFPTAQILGIDNSPDMLTRARADLPSLTFELATIESFSPAAPPDLLFSNAALQWVNPHEQIFPRLASLVAPTTADSPGGVFAMQMPYHLASPGHHQLRQQVTSAAWSTKYPATTDSFRFLTVPHYHELLAPHFRSVQIWTTTYHHLLPNHQSIVDWLSGTALLPWLNPLTPADRTAFLAEYFTRITAAYPLQSTGQVLFPFNRLFIIAER